MQSLPILVHTIFEELDTEVVHILPAMHPLTGCETTKKVGIKASGQQAAIEQGQKLLFDFGRDDLLVNMIPMAEYFLTKFISHATEFQTFDELRHHVYHIKNFQFAYSQSVLAMLSLVARTVCSFDHI